MKLTMNLGTRSYDIILKDGCLANLHQFADLTHRRVFVLTDSGVPARYAQTVLDQCANGTVYTIPQGEGSKCLKVYGQVLQAMLEFGMDRRDLLVAVGGGVVGDLGGFCAASYMRGIDFVNCPTTTLAQIDSSIGGKTAIDLGSAKNIVGAFWQPKVVLIDPETLATLPRRQYINGLAEAVKAGLIADPELFELFENGDVDKDIQTIIYRSLLVKKKIVEQDERESGARKALNFGHTIGHAFELAGHYETWTHGQGVAAGMNWAAQLGVGLGITPPEVAEQIRSILNKFGLPQDIPCPWETMTEAVGLDKKRTGDSITLILLERLGQAVPRRMKKDQLLELLEPMCGR